MSIAFFAAAVTPAAQSLVSEKVEAVAFNKSACQARSKQLPESCSVPGKRPRCRIRILSDVLGRPNLHKL